MFNDVLAMEYLMKNKKYSNGDHIWAPWMKIILTLFGLFISFMDTFYESFTSTHNSTSVKIHRVNKTFNFINSYAFSESV